MSCLEHVSFDLPRSSVECAARVAPLLQQLVRGDDTTKLWRCRAQTESSQPIMSSCQRLVWNACRFDPERWRQQAVQVESDSLCFAGGELNRADWGREVLPHTQNCRTRVSHRRFTGLAGVKPAICSAHTPSGCSQEPARHPTLQLGWRYEPSVSWVAGWVVRGQASPHGERRESQSRGSHPKRSSPQEARRGSFPWLVSRGIVASH